jgi:Domain of unknown function (DUF4432)
MKIGKRSSRECIEKRKMKINLNTVEFNRAETVLAEHGAITVSTLRYASGVAALRITNKVGEIIFLPYHGQQIWDAKFYGRRLTMRSMFDDPTSSTDYLSNYGAFMLHCGATAMGNPGVGDTHPLHGELPNAIYQSAELMFGEDEQGAFVEVSGHYRHTVAFTHNYVATPRIRINENNGRIGMHLEVKNLKATPMDVMYLAHVNFKPVDGSILIDTSSDDPSKVNVRDKFPEFFKPTAEYLAFIKTLQKEPKLHRALTKGKTFDPELVMGLTFKSDAKGWAHSMQALPDGTADFISHRPTELPRGVRWITRTANQDAIGIYLPATAEANGYTAEKAKGNVLSIEAGKSFTCALEFGALDAKDADEMKSMIEKV